VGLNGPKLHEFKALARMEGHCPLVRVVRSNNHLDGLARQGYGTKHGTMNLSHQDFSNRW
jgi:hypothetical protein